MSTGRIFETVSTSSANTELLGEQLGRRCKGGEVVELVSDLGGGKTTFVRGMARGMGSKDHVSSPTFKISNIYKAGRLELHHLDFYRLQEAGVIAGELAEVAGLPQAVVVVEWGDVVHHVLPDGYLVIRLESVGESSRRIIFSYPSHLSYLCDGLGTAYN